MVYSLYTVTLYIHSRDFPTVSNRLLDRLLDRLLYRLLYHVYYITAELYSTI